MITAFIAQMRMEWHVQIRRPFVWFAMLGYFALAFGATVEFAFGTSGYSWVNGGDAIATRALILSVLGIIVAAGVIGEAMSRDKTAGTEETLLVTGANKIVLGLGRFVVVFAIVLFISAMFIPGMLLATLMPGIAEERIGPMVFSHYLKAMGIYVLPNFLLMSALIYAIAARWRSQTAAFVVALGLIALYVTALMLLGKDVYRHDVFQLYALLDPYGNIASAEHSMTWTVAQNNQLFRPFEGLLLINRMLWIGIALILIVLGTVGMPLRLLSPKQKKINREKKYTGTSFWPKTWLDKEWFLMTQWEIKTLWRQPGVLLLLGFAAFSLWWAAASSVTHSFSLPTTDLLVHSAGYYFDKVLILLLVWYAADILWREQQHHVDELIDTLPTQDTLRLLSKTLALVVMVLVFWILSIVVNVVYQLSHGFYDLELGLYFVDTFIFKAPYYLWMVILALAMQVIIRQRFIAIAVVLMVYLSGMLFDALGLYHPVYRFGEVSFFWYSLMDGYGHFWQGQRWFLLYWSLAAAILWIVAWGCYARGTEPPPRRQLWRQRLLTGPGRTALSVSILAFVVVGCGIAYQTTVQHRWPLLNENAVMAEVEKTYRADWGKRPQPKVTAIKGQIDLYPELRRVNMQGVLTLENQDDEAINELLIFFHPHLNEAQVSLEDLAYRDQHNANPLIQYWHLHKPLAPGEVMEMSFKTASFPPEGFAAHSQHDDIPEVNPVEVIGNGTSLLNLNLMPAVGYSERLEHKPAWRRKKYGLSPSWALPESNVGVNVAHDTTHLSWVQSVDMIVSTSADQIPLYSGQLLEDLGVVDGRRTLHYRVDQPSRGWAEVMSGRYATYHQERPGLPPVDLYYHPPHDYTLAPMAEALLDAMAYFSERYGKPPFERFGMAEAAMHYNGFGARGGLAFVSEIQAWKTDLSQSQGEDLRQYASSFMGMSWWSDQIIPGNVPGAKMVLSGLPFWTSALHLHHTRSSELSRRLRLQQMMESYRARAKLDDEETPFVEAMKDSEMVRRKGVLSIVYLAELVGLEKLESVFAEFLTTWRYRPAPYPTAGDLVALFKARLPQAVHPQLVDVFEHITNWHLQVVNAQTWPLDNGQWQLKATIDASKYYTQGLGEEQRVSFDTPVPVIVFRGKGFEDDKVIERRWQVLADGRSELMMVLDEKPERLGVDPYLFLPDPNPYDNVMAVEVRAEDEPR